MRYIWSGLGIVGVLTAAFVGLRTTGQTLPPPGKPATVAELREQNRHLREELQRLNTEYKTILSLQGAAKKELQAMAAVLAAQPGAAFDFSQHSGEMCFTPGQGDMVHYALDPASTTEDMIYMIRAEPFIERGLQVAQFPIMPEQLGAMQPLQWYYYDGKTVEPHHGRRMGRPYLIMAVDVK